MMEFLKHYKKSVLGIMVMLIILVILFLIQTVAKKESPDMKIQNQDYVFSLDTTIGEKGTSSRPYINLKGDEVVKENEAIASLYYRTLQDKQNTFTYEFIVKEGLLFLKIKIDFYDPTVKGAQTRYLSYINDTKTGAMLTNEEVLTRFGYSDMAIEASITKKMQNYYNTAVKEGLLEGNECNFTCYLGWKDMKDIHDGTALYFKENNLVVYRGFTLKSIYADDKLYDKKEPFLFTLEK